MKRSNCLHNLFLKSFECRTDTHAEYPKVVCFNSFEFVSVLMDSLLN